MPVRFKIDPSYGIGLYTVPASNSTDDSPLINPLGYMSRVIVHSSLRYPTVVASFSGTLSLPAVTSGALFVHQTTKHVLWAHGQTGLPMIVGRITGGSISACPWTGSVPVAPLPPASSYKRLNWSRWLTLGVSGGNVVCYEDTAGKVDAATINYEIYVLSRDLSATESTNTTFSARISGTAFEFVTRYGTLSSERKYIREGSGFALVGGGKTATFNGTYQSGTSIIKQTTFKYAAGSHSVDADYLTLVSTTSPPAAPAATPNATSKTVQI